MPLPRFRLRTLMIAVAAVGVVFGGLAGLHRIDQQRQRFRTLARNHLNREYVNRLIMQGSAEYGDAKAITEQHRMLAEYHHALNLKYEHAARYPWLPVPPDEPEPR